MGSTPIQRNKIPHTVLCDQILKKKKKKKNSDFSQKYGIYVINEFIIVLLKYI